MKTDKILILFIFIALEFSCNKTDELNSPITVRSPHEVMITSDVETIVLKKLKNPSILSNIPLQDKISLIPHKSRNGFKATLHEDGTMETEFIILAPGGMTERRDNVPSSDLPEIGKIVTKNNLTKIYDKNGIEIISHASDQSLFERHVWEIIDHVCIGYPDILTYANSIDNLPGGSYT